MNADSDRYTPTRSPDQTRLPDEMGQPDADPRDTQPDRSQSLGADDQVTAAGDAARNLPAIDEHGEAQLSVRQRILDAIDQLASQIPYGEEFAQQTKEAVATALDYREAQALARQAELQRDLDVAP